MKKIIATLAAVAVLALTGCSTSIPTPVTSTGDSAQATRDNDQTIVLAGVWSQQSNEDQDAFCSIWDGGQKESALDYMEEKNLGISRVVLDDFFTNIACIN